MIKELIRSIYFGLRRPALIGLSFVVRSIRPVRHFNPDRVRKILIICQPRLGDNVLAQPAVAALRAQFAQVELVGVCNRYVEEFMLATGLVDRTLVDPGKGAGPLIAMILRLKKEHFNMAVDFTTDFTLRPAALAFLSGSDYTVGYDMCSRGIFFDSSIRPGNDTAHQSTELSRIVHAVKATATPAIPSLSFNHIRSEAVEAFFETVHIAAENPVIGIQPSGHYYTQRWPEEHFARLGDTLSAHATVLLIQTSIDRERVREIEERMTTKPIVLFSDSISSFMAILKRCAVFVCNNSGTLHLAAAMNIPTVSTMGPTIPGRWWPLGENNVVIRKDLPCMPCNSGICRIKTHECMTLISPEEVFGAVSTFLHP